MWNVDFTASALQCVYVKKLYPLKFKLSARYCINLTALNALN